MDKFDIELSPKDERSLEIVGDRKETPLELKKPFAEPFSIGKKVIDIKDEEENIFATFNLNIAEYKSGDQSTDEKFRFIKPAALFNGEHLRLVSLEVHFADGSKPIKIPEDFGEKIFIFLNNTEVKYGSACSGGNIINIDEPINTPEGMLVLFHELGHVKRGDAKEIVSIEDYKARGLSLQQELEEKMEHERGADASALWYIRRILRPLGVSDKMIKDFAHIQLVDYLDTIQASSYYLKFEQALKKGETKEVYNVLKDIRKWGKKKIQTTEDLNILIADVLSRQTDDGLKLALADSIENYNSGILSRIRVGGHRERVLEFLMAKKNEYEENNGQLQAEDKKRESFFVYAYKILYAIEERQNLEYEDFLQIVDNINLL